MTLALTEPPPLLTADLPGIGGRIKQQPEDFEVEEVPAYEPCGSGEFLYLWIEKRDLGAEYFVRQVAKRLRVPNDEVGTAGLKDRRAVTRQWVSVPADAEPRLAELDGEGIKVLRTGRHGNKLKPGHLHGNRFRIRNFYGPQRFGKNGETLDLGLRALRGEGESRNRFLRKLALSAAQSALFNACLAQRIRDGFLRQVLLGDVMAKWPFGGMFTVTDVGAEQPRFDRRETVHTGPMFGRKMFPTAGLAAEREAAILREAGLTAQSFHGFGKLLQGTRRLNLVYLDDLAATREEADVVLTFTLPAGSYATVLLREVMKTEPVEEDVGGEVD